MGRTVLQNNKGMSLVELLFALVILMIVSLALMQMQLTGMKMNVRNVLRDEAVGIADTRMNELTSKPFTLAVTDSELNATASTGVPEAPISRTIRSFSLNFNPTKTITDLTPDTKQITLSVSWIWSGQTFTHSVTTIKRKT